MQLVVATLALAFAPLLAAAATCATDPWSREPPMSQLAYLQAPSAKVQRVSQIPASGKATALKLLEREQVHRASPQTLQQLGIDLLPKTDEQAFLIRGLRYPTQGGGFLVSMHDRDLLVHFSFLGAPDGPSQREVLLVLLPSAPKRVYILCTGAS